VKWSDTRCLTTMLSGKWMFSVLSGSSNTRSWAGGYFQYSRVCTLFDCFGRSGSTLHFSPHSAPHSAPSFPRSASCASDMITSALFVQHLPPALGTQPSSSSTRGEKKCFKTFLVSQNTHTSLCQEPFTQSQCFRRLGVLETRAGSRPTSKMR
jgi:hypothetical protein